MMKERRYGNIKVSNQFVELQTETAAKMFASLQAVVLRCEFLYSEDSFAYTIYSPLFDIVDPYCIPPDYKIIVNQDDNREFQFSVEKIKG